MSMKKIFTLLFFSVLSFSVLFSQETDSITASYYKPTIQLDYLYGKIDNPIEIPQQTNSHYGKLSFLNKTGVQKQSFFSQYGSPEVGVSVIIGYLGNKEVLGSLFAFLPQWTYHVYAKKPVSFDVNIASGFAYISKPYHKISNPLNHTLGGHAASITDISSNVVFMLHQTMFLRAGVGMLLVTNGQSALPNHGIHDFTVRLGMIYKPGDLVGIKMPKRTVFANDSVWRKNIRLSYARHELGYTKQYPVDGPSYSIFSAAAYLSKQLSRINEVKFGIDYTYYNSYNTLIRFDKMYSHFKFFRASVISLQAGHEFLMHHFGLVTELGIKIHDPLYRNFFLQNDTSTGVWFKRFVTSRIGVEFYPYNSAFSGNKLSVGAYLKTNALQPDFIEYNMTYTF